MKHNHHDILSFLLLKHTDVPPWRGTTAHAVMPLVFAEPLQSYLQLQLLVLDELHMLQPLLREGVELLLQLGHALNGSPFLRPAACLLQPSQLGRHLRHQRLHVTLSLWGQRRGEGGAVYAIHFKAVVSNF